MKRTILFLLASFAALGACGGSRPALAPRVSPKPGVVAKENTAMLRGVDIDARLREAWKKEGVTPAAPADDATYLRRVTLDIVGTVPTADETIAFLADRAPDKRAKLVNKLLASPAYATHWAQYWNETLMGRGMKGDLVDHAAFRSWLRARFAENAPWDAMVRALVAATGESGDGGPKSRVPAIASKPEPEAEGVNGAVNWTLSFADAPQDLAGSASRIFLGAQIQCAQCHDHKTEKWKQDDFRRFANAFLHLKVEVLDSKEKGSLRRVSLVDAAKVPPRFQKKEELAPITRAKPTALDGTDLDKGEGTRKALAAWMTSSDNPWFARAIVNRMWGHFLGRGFYDPVDDLRATNEPELPELLDGIARDFAASKYDLAMLIRTICATEAYQLAAGGEAKADPENKLWGRFHVVPLGPEELLNSISRVTNVEKTAEKAGLKNLDQVRAQVAKQYVFLFDVDEADDKPDFSGNVSQALVLLNGALVDQGSRALPGSTLAEVVKGSGSDSEKIERLVVQVLARKPTDKELETWSAYIAQGAAAPAGKKGGGGVLERLANKKSDPKLAPYEDLFWALLNSSEFAFNH